MATGQPKDLAQLLHDHVVLVTDGGANVRAARQPILGATRVARFLAGVVKNAPPEKVKLDYVTANGQLSLHIAVDGQTSSLFTLEPDVTGAKVSRIFVLRNPDKLRNVTVG